jgi:hypothetical protein
MINAKAMIILVVSFSFIYSPNLESGRVRRHEADYTAKSFLFQATVLLSRRISIKPVWYIQSRWDESGTNAAAPGLSDTDKRLSDKSII